MQLPQFIQRALDFFTKAEANLTAAQELATTKAKVTELEGTIAAHLKTIGDRDATILDLQGQLKTAKDAAGEQEVKIKNLNTSVETEKRRANETIAAAGLPPTAVPGTPPNADAGGASKPLLEQLAEIADPKAKAAFIQKNFNALFVQARAEVKATQR